MFRFIIRIILFLFGLAVATITVATIIDKATVQSKIKAECSDAFKALIKEKKKNAIKVGIFDSDDRVLKDMEITSSKGVDESLYVGQVIYCR
jgi:hypothetical protein